MLFESANLSEKRNCNFLLKTKNCNASGKTHDFTVYSQQ